MPIAYRTIAFVFACVIPIACKRAPTPPGNTLLPPSAPSTAAESASSAHGVTSQRPSLLDAPPPVLLSHAPATQPAQHPAIAVDQQGNAHVLWQDHCMQSGTVQCPFSEHAPSQLPPDIVYRRIAAVPGSPAPAVLISSGGAHGRSDGASTSPAIAVSHDAVAHLVWSETGTVAHGRACPNRMCDAQIVYRSVTPTGALTPIQILSTAPGRSDFAAIAAAPVEKGSVVVVWFTAEATQGALYYRRLTAGKKWSNPVRFASIASPRTFPRVAVDAAGYAHVVWHDDLQDSKIYYVVIAPDHTAQMPSGKPSPPLKPLWVSDNLRFHNARNPDIAVVNNTALIVWKDQGSYQKPGMATCVPHCETDIILTARALLPKGGGAWITSSTDTASIRRFDRLSTAKSLANKDALQPSISGAGNTFTVAWRDTSAATDDIVVRTGTIVSQGLSAGYNVFETMVVAPQGGASHSPRVAQNSRGVTSVVWVDEAPFPAHINVIHAATFAPVSPQSPPDRL